MKINCFPILSFLLLLPLLVSGQVRNLVDPAPINDDIHKSNIGKLFFTEKRISKEQLRSEDFLTTYTLTNKSDLFFIAFFDNSLTNFKHRLSPEFTAEELFKSGNYQFAMYVDDKLVYQSNLLPGAPSQKSQNTDTYLNRPLIDNLNGQGTWSESFWNRFMLNGGDRVLTDGRHQLRMEIRPYINSGKLITGELIASGELLLQVERTPKINVNDIELNTLTPYNGLPVSDLPFDKEKIKYLKGAINEGVYKKVNGIIVLKHGKILIEEYFNGENRNSLHDPRSVGKSFSSTLMGIATKKGFIKGEDQAIGEFYDVSRFQNYSEAKTLGTIKDLLTMSSGFDGNDEVDTSAGNEENMYPTADWVKFALDLPYRDDLKSSWHYFTAGTVLLGDILNKSVLEGLEKFADEMLFSPLGIKNYKWQYTPQNIPNTAGGIQMSALDFAKYGQLYKNNGLWHGKQILSKDWIDKTFTKHRQITNRDNEYYGYLFWNKSFKAAGKPHEAFYCAGNGGNYILIFKDQPLVIVITASAYGQYYAHGQVKEMLENYILPAIAD
ncbi:serine hydrolase domain-containing protein [Flavobacterium sp.]